MAAKTVACALTRCREIGGRICLDCKYHRLKADGSVSPAKIKEAHGREMPLCGCREFGKKR